MKPGRQKQAQMTMNIRDSWLAQERRRTPLSALVPSALVYLDSAAASSPNCRAKDPSTYVRQAVCLNRSLLHAGMPRLNIYTNAIDAVNAVLADIPDVVPPAVHMLQVSRSDLPKSTPFYAAHFKLDLMTQAARSLPRNALFLLLDTDMVAMRPLSPELLDRVASLGAGVFDISDQVFPAYGSDRVIADLDRVAGRTLLNPRWYGGEFLLCTPAFLDRLVERGKACFGRYVGEIGHLHHNGDEAFISSALSLMAEDGCPLVEVGAYQAVGRHWPGNTYRNLYWFSRCAFLHLPGSKSLIDDEAHYADFDAARLWRALSFGHRMGQLRMAVKLLLHGFPQVHVRPALARIRRPGTETKLEAPKGDASTNV